MAKPATTFTFATNTVNNGTFNTPNKKAPSATKLEDGFLVETLHRGELNYLFNQIGEWITYLADDVNGEKIEFGTSKVEIPVIDGDILSTRNNVLKQRITSNTTDFLNDIRTESISGDNHFSVNKETGEITAPLLTGNAGTATKLETSRTIELTGDVTGSAIFDGTSNLDISATVNGNLHEHDAAKITTGTLSNARLNKASSSTQGILKVSNSLNSTSSLDALSSSGGKNLQDQISSLLSSHTTIWTGNQVTLDMNTLPGGWPGDGFYLANGTLMYLIEDVTNSVVHYGGSGGGSMSLTTLLKNINNVIFLRKQIYDGSSSSEDVNITSLIKVG